MNDGYFDNPYFTRAELRLAPGLRLHPEFLPALLDLRRLWGRPMQLTSGARSAARNREVGGAADSMHIADTERGCLAVDVAVSDSSDAHTLAMCALHDDWSVGVSTRGFLHLDARWLIGRPPVLFGY
jgi:uncharacterized protein YcbK (DUF882 family)